MKAVSGQAVICCVHDKTKINYTAYKQGNVPYLTIGMIGLFISFNQRGSWSFLWDHFENQQKASSLSKGYFIRLCSKSAFVSLKFVGQLKVRFQSVT